MEKTTEKKEDEVLTPVGDGVEETEPVVTEPQENDEKVSHAEVSDEDDDHDESGEPDDERAKIRQRRRREKQRRAQRIQSERRELEFLRKRNAEVERQLSQVSLRQERLEETTVDGRIGQLENQIREAEQIHAQAVDAKDGTTATEALRVKSELEKVRDKLKSSKEERAREREQQAAAAKTQRETPTADPDVVLNGREWLKRNDWFDPQLTDEDSFLARAIEERLAREGRYDPRDPEYWEELDRRIDKRLPGLRKKGKSVRDSNDLDWEEDDEKPQSKKKPSGPRIAVGGKTRALKPNEVYLSAQRIEALKQAGVWDDPEKQQRYLKAYKQYDEEAAARNS